MEGCLGGKQYCKGGSLQLRGIAESEGNTFETIVSLHHNWQQDLKLFFIRHIIRNQGAAVGQKKGSLMTSQRHFWQSVAAKMSLMQVCI